MSREQFRWRTASALWKKLSGNTRKVRPLFCLVSVLTFPETEEHFA